MDKLEMTGKTVEEAIEIALMELDVDRAEVAVEVVNPGKVGLFGLRSEPAKVVVTRLSEQDSAAANGIRVLTKLLTSMNLEASPRIRSEGDEDNWPILDVTGEDSGLMIGRRGETLKALQFVVNLILRRQGHGQHIIIDVERYRERRNKSVESLAKRAAERVVSTGNPVTLEPMSPSERRVVHVTLAQHPEIITESNGSGEGRRVTLMPR